MPTGLGDEELWLSPTVANNVSPFNDQSGNGNNGTAQGGMMTIADSGSGGSYAYDFDGTDDYIDVVSSGVPAAAYSVSLWQYSTKSAVNTAFNAGQVGGERTVNIDGVRSNTFGDSHGHKRGGTSYFVTSNVVRSSATWYHYLLTYDGSELKLYVNGTYVGNKTGVPNTDWIEDRCWIGQYIGGSFFFQGRMDDIRTYDRALTQAEIVHLSEARGIEGTPPVGLGDEKLWLCPTLNDSANDISGNGNDGTYQGGMATIVDTGAGGSQAYNHDTTGREILLPADLGISGTSMSISMWFNNTSNAVGSNADNWFGAYDNTYANSNMRIYQFQNLILADDRNESPDTFINPYTTLSTTNSWVHVVAVADGSAGEYRFYVDGVLEDTVSSGGSDMTVKTTVPWRVGGGGISPSAIGMSDDIRAYGRVLTQAEITHLATSRGIEGGPSAGGFYNPFINKTFNQNYTRRIG
jgi:hypothetical protein